jgi:hypothetical protein
MPSGNKSKKHPNSRLMIPSINKSVLCFFSAFASFLNITLSPVALPVKRYTIRKPCAGLLKQDIGWLPMSKVIC